MTTQTHKWLPSEPTDEMVNAALTEFNVPEGAFTEIFRRVLIKAWQAAPEAEQEPVAYRYTTHDGYTVLSEDYHRLEDSEPLYTHPHPKPEPLDDETVLGIARTIPNLSGDDSALIQFARELGV